MRPQRPWRGLYVITRPPPPGGRELSDEVAAAIAGGARWVQYRDKGVDRGQRREEAAALARLCRRCQVPLIVNDDPRLAAEVERQIDAARVSPGAEEAALFERFARLMDDGEFRFDRIVFDTAPTGQTLRLLSLPELMSAWIGGLVSQRKKVSYTVPAGGMDYPAIVAAQSRAVEKLGRDIVDAIRNAGI